MRKNLLIFLLLLGLCAIFSGLSRRPLYNPKDPRAILDFTIHGFGPQVSDRSFERLGKPEEVTRGGVTSRRWPHLGLEMIYRTTGRTLIGSQLEYGGTVIGTSGMRLRPLEFDLYDLGFCEGPPLCGPYKGASLNITLAGDFIVDKFVFELPIRPLAL